MKPTTFALIAESRERKAVGYSKPMRDYFASFYRRNRACGRYVQLRDYAHARAVHLLSVGYPGRAVL